MRLRLSVRKEEVNDVQYSMLNFQLSIDVIKIEH